jgi:hypothetical protein
VWGRSTATPAQPMAVMSDSPIAAQRLEPSPPALLWPFIDPVRVSEPVPVFENVNGQISIRSVRKPIETGMAKLGRELAQEEEHVLDYIDEVTQRPDQIVTMRMQPGDMQFVNNHEVLHSRTGYEDHREPERRRHLVRLWLKIERFRQLDARLVGYDEASGLSRREEIRPPNAPAPKSEARSLLAAPSLSSCREELMIRVRGW